MSEEITTSFLGEIKAVRWSPAGNVFATASTDSVMKIIDFATGKTVLEDRTGISIRQVALSEINS